MEPLDTATLAAALNSYRRRLEVLELAKPDAPAGTLPTNPATGQRAVLTHTTGQWDLVWSGAAWLFAGGSDLVGYTDAEVMIDVNTYPASPQGPTVTVPRSGTYDVWLEARHRHAHSAVLFTAMMARVGAGGVGQERAPVLAVGAQVPLGSWVSEAAGIVLAAGQQISFGARAPNGGGIDTFYAWRQIRVRPRALL